MYISLWIDLNFEVKTKVGDSLNLFLEQGIPNFCLHFKILNQSTVKYTYININKTYIDLLRIVVKNTWWLDFTSLRHVYPHPSIVYI